MPSEAHNKPSNGTDSQNGYIIPYKDFCKLLETEGLLHTFFKDLFI